MVNYRRARVPGATYFFTVTLRDRRSRVLVDHVDVLREVVQCVKRLWPFRIDALVVLPDHLHTIWTLPEREADFSKRWRAIKARFTRRLVKRGIVLAHDRRGEYELWQRRFWEHLIRDEKDFVRHVDYIHYNPVKHGWVADRWTGVGLRYIDMLGWGCSHRIGRTSRRKADSAKARARDWPCLARRGCNDSRIPLRSIQATLAGISHALRRRSCVSTMECCRWGAMLCV